MLSRAPGGDYVRAVVKKAHELTIDENTDAPLPFKACPSCGSSRLEFYSATDYAHDRVYHFVECADCSWRNWTE